MPLPVSSSQGTFAVEARDGGSVVVLDAEFEPSDPAGEAELKQMLEAAYGEALASLRRRVEPGLRWDAA